MGDSSDELTLESEKSRRKAQDWGFRIVKLFKLVIQSQFKTFFGQLKAEQSKSISRKLKEISMHKIKFEVNRVQYDFNAELLEGLEKLESRVLIRRIQNL